MTPPYLVGDLVAEFIASCGVKAAFGIISVHNIPMLDAIQRQGKVGFVMTRNEMGAAHMADGYARANGGLGVIFSSTGPGAANAVGGIVEAKFAGTPVLHITGQSPYTAIGRGQGGVHDVPDQLGMLKSVSKAALRINSPKEALGVLMQAAVTALSGRPGPVSIEVPFDIQRTEIARPSIFDNFVLPLPPKRVPEGAELERLVEHIAKAKRPMLWLGAGAREAGFFPGELLARRSRGRVRAAACRAGCGRSGVHQSALRAELAVSKSRRKAAARFRGRIRRQDLGAVFPEVHPLASGGDRGHSGHRQAGIHARQPAGGPRRAAGRRAAQAHRSVLGYAHIKDYT